MLALGTTLTLAEEAAACGWWGDGESTDTLHVVTVRGDGRAVPEADADAVSPEEMILIGNRFRTGSGGLRDLSMAVHWYRAAARRGHVGGQYNLAMMYDRGMGVARDYDQAAEWYLRAAEQGDVHAQHHLGDMYRRGRGVTRDPVKAAYWSLQAAEQGHAEVFSTVAKAYWVGAGVQQDRLLGLTWWRLAAEYGDEPVPDDVRAADARLDSETEAKIRGLVDQRRTRWRQADFRFSN